jgi:hypothetical protein
LHHGLTMKRPFGAIAIMLIVNTGLFLLARHLGDSEWPMLWIPGLTASLASAFAAFMVGKHGLLLGTAIGVVTLLSVFGFGTLPLRLVMILTGEGIRALWSFARIAVLPGAPFYLLPAITGAYVGEELKRVKLRRSCTQAGTAPRIALGVSIICGCVICLLGVVIFWIVIIRCSDLGVAAQAWDIAIFLPIAFLAVMGLLAGIRQLRRFRE